MKKLLTILAILAVMPMNLNAESILHEDAYVMHEDSYAISSEIHFRMDMADAGTEWELGRARVDFKGSAGEGTTYRLTLDGKYSDRDYMDPYVKYAYATTKTSMGKLTFGQFQKPWNSMEDKFSGRRFIYKSTPDSEGWMASQDMGLQLQADWLFNKGMKIYMTSGEDGKSAEGEDGHIGIFMQHELSDSMTFSLLSESGSHGAEDNDTSLILGHLGYKAGSFAFAFGFADGEIDNTGAGITTTTSREGTWFDLSVAMTDGVTLFLRSKDTTDDNEVSNMIMGIQTRINDSVDVALAFESDDTDGTAEDTISLGISLVLDPISRGDMLQAEL